MAGCADDDSVAARTASHDNDDGAILIPPYSGPLPSPEPTTTSPAGQEFDMIGTITAPMPGCLVLESDEGRWELTGMRSDDLGPGDKVEVFGQLAPEDEGRCDAPVVHVDKIALLSSVSHQVG